MRIWCLFGIHLVPIWGRTRLEFEGFSAMAALTLSHCAAAVSTAGAHRCSEMVGSARTKVASFAGLRSEAFAPKLEKSLRDAVAAVPSAKTGCGGALAASMVVAPAVRGTDVEFQTEVFKKEKITPAGRDEVSRLLVRSSGI